MIRLTEEKLLRFQKSVCDILEKDYFSKTDGWTITDSVVRKNNNVRFHGINIKKEGLKMLVISAISAGGATIAGKTIASNLFKLVPGAGSVVGGSISAGTAGVVTLAMGKAFIEVSKMVKLGKLSEHDMLSNEGKAIFRDELKKQLKHKKQ